MLANSENTDFLKSYGFMHSVKVPLCHQETPYSCGVACVQSLLAGYGIIYTQDVLAEHLKQKPIYGTDFRNIITFMEMLGFQASFHTDMNIDQLKAFIDKGITPLLILQAWKDDEINYTYDWKDSHYVIACGYDQNRILFMDPWTLGYYTVIPNIKLSTRWHTLDSSGNHYFFSGLIIKHEVLPFVYNPNNIKPMD
jgi:ABC-type bacteriocin/lantibiotic exporter with double-glycine peptidase domain